MVSQLFHRARQRARTASPLLACVASDFADASAPIVPSPPRAAMSWRLRSQGLPASR